MNNLGQMGMGPIVGIVMGIVGVFVAVILIASFFPTMQDQFDSLRHQDALNCVSTTDVCGGAGSNVTCYNASVGQTHTMTCAIQSIGLPLILIMLILGALGAITGVGYAMR